MSDSSNRFCLLPLLWAETLEAAKGALSRTCRSHGSTEMQIDTRLTNFLAAAEDCIGRLFANHVNGADNENSGDPWKDRSIYHSQA